MGKVVHFEIPVDDPDRAKTFYETAFGWSFQGYGDQPYWLTAIGPEDAGGIEGALIGRGDVHAHPVVIIDVDDIDAAMQGAIDAGAEKVARPHRRAHHGLVRLRTRPRGQRHRAVADGRTRRLSPPTRPATAGGAGWSGARRRRARAAACRPRSGHAGRRSRT